MFPAQSCAEKHCRVGEALRRWRQDDKAPALVRDMVDAVRLKPHGICVQQLQGVQQVKG
jgi:hypothetical protein